MLLSSIKARGSLDAAIERVAERFSIPPNFQRSFAHDLKSAIDEACDQFNRSRPWSKSKSGHELATLSVALHNCLGSLNEQEWAQLERGPCGEGIRGLHEKIYCLAMSSSALVGTAPPSRQPTIRGRGRPPGSISNPIFQELIFRLCVGALVAGGKFTLTTDAPSGTLVDALDLLRPLVPIGLIPHQLTGSMLERQRQAAQRSYQRARAQDSEFNDCWFGVR